LKTLKEFLIIFSSRIPAGRKFYSHLIHSKLHSRSRAALEV